MHSNWSQATLVNPDTKTILTFSKPLDGMSSTLWLDDRPYLQVATVDNAGPRTMVTDLQTNEVLLTIRQRKLHPDTVTFAHKYEGRSVKQKDWLVVGKTADGRKKWTMQSPQGAFVWRKNASYRLALYPECEPNRPVVHARFPTSANPSTPLALVLSHGTEFFWDEIIASFLILEEAMRAEEKENTTLSFAFSDSF